MVMFARQSIVAILLASIFGSSASAQSCPPSSLTQSATLEFTTVAGQKLVLPAINSMECPDIDKMLARIDSTRYRGNAPQPDNIADCPLLSYELLLAEENYNRCVVERKNVSDGLRNIERPASQ